MPIVVPETGEMPQMALVVEPDGGKRGDKPFSLNFKVSKLTVPRSKGTDVKNIYNTLAEAGALAATIGDFSQDPKIKLKQARDAPPSLRDRWLDRVAWPRKVADALSNWKDAGGDATTFYVAGGGKETCQTDHVVELQVGGNNTKENLRPLDGEMNELAGRTLWTELWSISKAIRAEPQLAAEGAS